MENFFTNIELKRLKFRQNISYSKHLKSKSKELKEIDVIKIL